MIKNIIFDLGGVILNIDFQQAADSFKRLGLKDFDQLYSKAQQSDLFKRLEKGLISPEEFRKELKELAQIPMSDSELDQAWNNLILDFPTPRLNLLKELGKNYRIFLLSNTNKIHADYYNHDLRNQHQIDGLEKLFEKVYYSHDIGQRKPDAEAFEVVLHNHDLKASETLFIDDSYPNIAAAEALGLRTLFLDQEKGLELTSFFKGAKFTVNE